MKSIQKNKAKQNTQNIQSKPTLYQKLAVVGALLLCFIVYLPALKNDVTNWDDGLYVTDNQFITELNSETLNSIFFAPETRVWVGNYHPLTMLSLSVDYQFAKNKTTTKVNNDKLQENPKFDPFAFHFTNVILHIINTLLVFVFVFLLLQNFEIAFIAAILFAVNALHVESVAWISERKDVLYTMFFLLSLITYLKYIKSNKYILLAVSFLCFFLSLLSKGQAVSLAVTLVLLDWFTGRKMLSIKVLIEKIPFFILSLVFGIIAIKAQNDVFMEKTDFQYYHQILFGLYGYGMYVVKLLVPFGLSAYYPYPNPNFEAVFQPKFFFFTILAIAIVSAFFYFLKKSKNIAFGIAFFSINIFLVLQFFPVGSAIMADRYVYLPSVGFFVIVAYLFVTFALKSEKLKSLSIGILSFYVLFLSIQTILQCRVWQNSVSLWENITKSAPFSAVAWSNLGGAYDATGNIENAQLAFSKAIEYKSDFYRAWNNLGSAHYKLGKKENAIKNFTQAIAYKSDNYEMYYNRGLAFRDLNKHKEAISDFDKAIELNSNFGEAFYNRGISKEVLGEFASALSDYNRGITLLPNFANLYYSRAHVKGITNDFTGAIPDFDKAIELNPQNVLAYSDRAYTYMKINKLKEAINDYNTTISLAPQFAMAFSNRGNCKRQLNDYQGAISDLTKAVSLEPKLADAYVWRAMVYFETGDKLLACNDISAAAQMGFKIDASLKAKCK